MTDETVKGTKEGNESWNWMRLEGTPLCFLSSTLFPALSVIS
jgi:hypothetical protein